jgi:hypothetical protein
MPLSSGILLGLFFLLVGLIFLIVTNHKKLGIFLMGAGVILALITGAIIVLAVNSSM